MHSVSATGHLSSFVVENFTTGAKEKQTAPKKETIGRNRPPYRRVVVESS
jgi:hypothetical protein